MKCQPTRPVKKTVKSRAPAVIDLFAGGGFFGMGFAMEGFRLAHSYEHDEMTAGVNAMNSRSPVSVADLSSQSPAGKCDVLIAGPPCQGFSSLGSRSVHDPRNSLCLVIPAWVAKTRPRVVVVENVPAFLASKSWELLGQEMESMGYERSHITINARHYGVPQNRSRSLTFFSLSRLPNLDHQKWAIELNIRDAFTDLPKCPCPKIQHYTLPSSKLAQERIKLVPYGGDIRDIHIARPDLVPPSWLKVKGRIIDIWGRLRWDGISNTIRTGFLHPSRGRFLHPEEDRVISFREAARIQSIPDSYMFTGYAEHMARQIGNGVPVNLARAVARAVKEVL